MEKIFSEKYKNLIIRDRYFLLIDNKENRKFATINQSSHKIDLKFFENKQLNTFWNVEDTVYTQITSQEFFDQNICEGGDLDYGNVNIVNNSNKEIYSDGSAQKLSEKQIKLLKDQGISGEEIIKLVLENNSTMEKRTLLSQEKILKKKERMHKYKLWISPINMLNATETLFLENPRTINYLRMDTISTILSYANLTQKANSLIVEDCNGLLVSSFALRSSINCNIMSIFTDRIKTKYQNLLYMKRRDKYPITYMKLDHLANSNSQYYKLFSKLYYNYFENIVICINDDQNLLKMLTVLFPYIKLCGVIIIYSRELEVLVNLEKFLFESKLALDTRIHETIVREFQVLPLRTHPNMNNKGYSGYVFTGLKINEM